MTLVPNQNLRTFDCIAYPDSALPEPIWRPVRDVAEFLNVPIEMAAISAMSVISSVVQATYDLDHPFGGIRPTSLFTLTIARSGDGKSETDRVFSDAIRVYRDEIDCESEGKNTRYELDLAIRDAKLQGLKRSLRRFVEAPDRASVIEGKIRALRPPIPPQGAPILFVSDISEAALINGLEGEGKNVFLRNDDADKIFDSDLYTEPGVLCKSYGGESYEKVRGRQIIKIKNQRLGMSLAIHPERFEQHRKKNAGRLRSSGLLPRCLIVAPESLAGHRYAQSLDFDQKKMHEFNALINRLLKIMSGLDNGRRRIVRFSNSALNHFLDLHNDQQTRMQEGGIWEDVREAASRMMDNVARIATNLHCATETDPIISLDTLRRGYDIGEYHMFQYRRRVSDEPTAETKLQDKRKLQKYLRRLAHESPGLLIRITYLQRHAPVRTSEFQAALRGLWMERKVAVHSLYFEHPNPPDFIVPYPGPLLPLSHQTRKPVEYIELLHGLFITPLPQVPTTSNALGINSGALGSFQQRQSGPLDSSI